MPAESTRTPPPPPVARRPIAGFWRRLAAFLIDGIIVVVPTLLLGLALFQWAASLGQAGRLVGFAVALAYFGVLNSRLGGGQTLGKRLLDIRVVDRAGRALSPQRSGARFVVLAIPFFFNGLILDVDPTAAELVQILSFALLSLSVFGGLAAIVYLYVFNWRTRQSLHDLAVGSFVVRGAEAPLPAALATPRLHLVVAGCLLMLAVVAPAIFLSTIGESPPVAALTSGGRLDEAIEARLGVRQVDIKVGQRSVSTVQTGSSTVTFLRVQAQRGDAHAELDALAAAIARMVLDRHPDLLGRQVLIVKLRHGFDFGIARWFVTYREALDAAQWRDKLARLPTNQT